MLKITTKVLVMSDNDIFACVLVKGLSTDSSLEIDILLESHASINKILELRPDVLICVVKSSKGLEIKHIRELLSQIPLPIIIVTSDSRVNYDALNVGVIDFVNRPNLQSVSSVENFIFDLLNKIKIASSRASHWNKKVNQFDQRNTNMLPQTDKIIAIGASTGGTDAIFQLLSTMPSSMPGIVIVQHIPANFSRLFAERLKETTMLEVKEAKTGDYLERGKVLIAPGDHHMVVKKINDKYMVRCFQGDRVNGHIPSVDVLFQSVAKEAKEQSIGIILTGMGNDGANGLLTMRKMGAITIGQDKKTSVVYGMPKVAYDIGAVERQVPLQQITPLILSLLENKQ